MWPVARRSKNERHGAEATNHARRRGFGDHWRSRQYFGLLLAGGEEAISGTDDGLESVGHIGRVDAGRSEGERLAKGRVEARLASPAVRCRAANPGMHGVG